MIWVSVSFKMWIREWGHCWGLEVSIQELPACPNKWDDQSSEYRYREGQGIKPCVAHQQVEFA